MSTDAAGVGEEKIPAMIAVRTDDYAKQIKRWRKTNRRVPWSCLLRDALENYFKKEAA